jgi:hypothetical protein
MGAEKRWYWDWGTVTVKFAVSVFSCCTTTNHFHVLWRTKRTCSNSTQESFSTSLRKHVVPTHFDWTPDCPDPFTTTHPPFLLYLSPFLTEESSNNSWRLVSWERILLHSKMWNWLRNGDLKTPKMHKTGLWGRSYHNWSDVSRWRSMYK